MRGSESKAGRRGPGPAGAGARIGRLATILRAVGRARLDRAIAAGLREACEPALREPIPSRLLGRFR